MKKIQSILFVVFASLAFGQQTLSLEETYRLARENYPLIKRQKLIEKARQYNLENANKAWLPQISVTGQATYQSDVTQLPIQLPNIDIKAPDKFQYKVYADVSQTIYDGGRISSQKKLAEANSDVELQKNEVEMEQLKERINNLYFGILQTDEQTRQLDLTKSDIQNGLRKAEAQLKYGVILRSNVDVMKANLVDIEQRQIELAAVRKNYLDMLAVFLGKNLDENTTLLKPEKLLLTDTNNRPELKLFDLQNKLLDAQKKALNAKNMPSIGAFGQAGYGKPGLNMLKNSADDFYIGGVRLNIPISGFYTRKNDLALIENQRLEVEVQRENFLFNQKFQTLQNDNSLKKIQSLIDKDAELVALRESIKKAALAQLENGVINTSDYLREVNAEENAKTQRILHETQFLLTQYNLQAQLGN